MSKAFALEELAADLGINRSAVAAFGDMPNDLPMLAWAGHSVAVANAHPDVLAAANEITLSNDENGVAVVLERLAGQLSRLSLLTILRPGRVETSGRKQASYTR